MNIAIKSSDVCENQPRMMMIIFDEAPGLMKRMIGHVLLIISDAEGHLSHDQYDDLTMCMTLIRCTTEPINKCLSSSYG